MSTKMPIGRRSMIAASLGVIGLAVAGGIAYEVMPLWRPRYRPSRFDDLLSQLADRQSAATLGGAVLGAKPDFDPDEAARKLRAAGSLATAIEADITAGRLEEIHGWLLPRSLADVAAIAAKSQ